MVSLGALNSFGHCPYSCPFCYVQADFLSYPALGVPAIVQWLSDQPSDTFDIVYVSGDTDSFAPPRTLEGLFLLEQLLALGKDVLFTTRMVFGDSALDRLGQIAEMYARSGLRLFGCMSVAQSTIPRLEPPPIASPLARLKQLHTFRAAGLIAILAVRPFLPIVPLSDYEWILAQAVDGAHAVLGEVWYVDTEGVLESNVLGSERLQTYDLATMPFDNNLATWKVYMAHETQEFFSVRCRELGLPFFMRSRPAIDFIRANL